METDYLIIGWIGYNNIGDELILHSLLSYLEDEHDNITVISGNPQQTEMIHGIKASPINFSAIKKIRKAQRIIFTGGQLFHDNRIRTIPLWSSILQSINLLNKDCKIALLNQGFETQNKILLKIMRTVFSHINFISVRDSTSFRIINKLNLNLPIYFGPDIFFAMNFSDIIENSLYKKKKSRISLGINIRSSFWWQNISNIQKFEQSIAKSLDSLILERDIDLVFFPFSIPGKEFNSDLEIIKNIVSKMKNKDNATIYKHSFNKNYFKNLITTFCKLDLVIGMALHSLILSCKLSIPFLTIPYQKKCEVFMKDNDLTKFILKSNEILSPDLLLKRVTKMIDSKDKIKSLIVSKNKSMYNDSKQAHIHPLLKMNI